MMSMIFLTGMLIYEGYRLWLWSNLGPTLPILPPPSDLDGIDIKTDYIKAVMTDPSVTKFDTDKKLNENGFTLAPHIDYRATSPNEVAVPFVTYTNNLLIQANNGTTTSGPKSDSYSSTDPLLMEPEIKLDTSRNFSKISDLLLLLRVHANTTHKVIFIKNKNKNTSGKPTPFDIIFNALDSKPQSLTSHLGHVINSIKPTYGGIPKPYSSFMNAETTTVRDQLKEIYQLISKITIERNAVKKSKTTAALKIRPNTAIEDTLQTMQILNDSYKYTRDPKKSERGLTEDLNYLIPYTTKSELTVHEIEARITTEIIETISKENTYSLPTPLAYNKNTKSNQETKSTLFKRVKRNNRLNNFYAMNNIVRRKMRNGRLYYTKSSEQKTTELQIVNTTIASSTPSNIVNESYTTSYLLKTSLEIDDDENDISEENEVYTPFETESPTSSLNTLNIEHELNTPIDNNEEDESESVEETEKTPTKTYKNKFDAIKHTRIEIPNNVIQITTIKDDEEETESGEVTEVSPMTHDDNNTCYLHKNIRKPLPLAKRYVLKKHLDGEVSSNNIKHEKNNRKTRTPKPYFDVINSTKNVMKVTNNIEDESGSAETTSVSTTIVEDIDEKLAEELDIIFILKSRLAKPTAATTSFESKDLLQILLPNNTRKHT